MFDVAYAVVVDYSTMSVLAAVEATAASGLPVGAVKKLSKRGGIKWSSPRAALSWSLEALIYSFLELLDLSRLFLASKSSAKQVLRYVETSMRHLVALREGGHVTTTLLDFALERSQALRTVSIDGCYQDSRWHPLSRLLKRLLQRNRCLQSLRELTAIRGTTSFDLVEALTQSSALTALEVPAKIADTSWGDGAADKWKLPDALVANLNTHTLSAASSPAARRQHCRIGCFKANSRHSRTA